MKSIKKSVRPLGVTILTINMYEENKHKKKYVNTLKIM